jgi:2-polyprenyl-3-methyl-5-hydroxy-6-metoxy-1,4-benzoquinol methylase
MLARMGHRVAGVDIASSAINWANERAATEFGAPAFMIGNVVDLRGQSDAFLMASSTAIACTAS